jgi:16S rRNA (cytidine1402-2'-O)-methyltransferase
MPPKKGRQKRLAELAESDITIIFYESPYRVIKLLEELVVHFGPERPVTVVREISKKFEEIVRGSTAEVLAQLQSRDPKGEFVVVVGGK